MIIYKDLTTGDEMASDSYPMKEVDGAVYEVECANIEVGGESFDTGANESLEEQEEGVEDKKETVNNVVYAFRLQQTSFDKKTYLVHLKGYMKKVKSIMQEKGYDASTISEFETKTQAYVKKILTNLKDYDFYTGESMDPDGMVALLNFREDGVTPYMTIWKFGLEEMKV